MSRLTLLLALLPVAACSPAEEDDLMGAWQQAGEVDALAFTEDSVLVVKPAHVGATSWRFVDSTHVLLGRGEDGQLIGIELSDDLLIVNGEVNYVRVPEGGGRLHQWLEGEVSAARLDSLQWIAFQDERDRTDNSSLFPHLDSIASKHPAH